MENNPLRILGCLRNLVLGYEGKPEETESITRDDMDPTSFSVIAFKDAGNITDAVTLILDFARVYGMKMSSALALKLKSAIADIGSKYASKKDDLNNSLKDVVITNNGDKVTLNEMTTGNVRESRERDE